ncbi:MAG: hypothetical protein ACTSRH_06930 [Promethearchaeota archaeon]
MSEEKKKKPRGFAGAVAKQIEPLNQNEKFKEDFKDTELKILLNAKDGKYAALIVIDKGKIYVEGVKNKPKKNIKKKVLGWDGLIEAKTDTFLLLLSGEEVSTLSLLWKILTFKLKIRGAKNVMVLNKLFEY